MAIDPAVPRSRRSLLAGVLGGVAAAAAATLAGAQRVLAAGDDGTPIVVGGIYDNAHGTTQIINNTNNQPVFRVASNQSGTGLEAISQSGMGVYAHSASSAGVLASSGLGAAVHAVGGTFPNMYANDTYPAAVLGEVSRAAGVAILGNNYATSGVAQGVQGTSHSPKGYATTGWADRGGTALVGVSGTAFPTAAVPANTGVFGYSQNGRGGVFRGKVSQLRLVPSTAATHPASGQAGDLFMDSARRLWLCKGGTNWKLVA